MLHMVERYLSECVEFQNLEKTFKKKLTFIKRQTSPLYHGNMARISFVLKNGKNKPV